MSPLALLSYRLAGQYVPSRFILHAYVIYVSAVQCPSSIQKSWQHIFVRRISPTNTNFFSIYTHVLLYAFTIFKPILSHMSDA
jgi:hypothetical protein